MGSLYRAEGKKYNSQPPFWNGLAIHYGIDYERTYMTWCRWVIKQLEQRLHAGARWAAGEDEPSSLSSSEQFS